jgi:hypothetical protein
MSEPTVPRGPLMSSLIEILRVFEGSDGEATRALYGRLEGHGPIGQVAMNLFRACKTSQRAKAYRGRRYRGAAYDTKQYSLDLLCAHLVDHAAAIGVSSWAWGLDPEQPVHRDVLYIDLPTGQVSFHTGQRGRGPDYPGAWDGVRDGKAHRVRRGTAGILDGRAGAAIARAEAAATPEQLELLANAVRGRP